MKKIITKTYIQVQAERKAADEASRCPYCSIGVGEIKAQPSAQIHYRCHHCGTCWYVERDEITARAKEIEKIIKRDNMF